MKLNFTRIPRHYYFQFLPFLFAIAIVCNSCAVGDTPQLTKVKGYKNSNKERDIKLYPDIVKRVMHVKNVDQEMLDFYVFDIEGTIKIHYKINPGDRKKVSGLERGDYVYQVFKGDEMSDSGKFIIK